MSNKKNKLFLVHCVDTEGPLVETLNATFKRLKDNKNIYLKASSRNLTKLQNKEINLNGRENEIADYIHKKRITYLENWNEVGNMLKKIQQKSLE